MTVGDVTGGAADYKIGEKTDIASDLTTIGGAKIKKPFVMVSGESQRIRFLVSVEES